MPRKQAYCSKRCVSLANLAAALPEPRFTSGRCRVCGSWFVTRGIDNVTCSASCQERNRIAIHHMLRSRAKALALGLFIEDVNPLDVYERDGWCCQLCSEPIDPDLKHPHPRSATTDHIVPLALGGTHELVQCQAAHLICNVRKGTRILAA